MIRLAFPCLLPLVPYRVPEAQKAAEESTLDRGLAAALEYLDRRGLKPGFKEHRSKESGT